MKILVVDDAASNRLVVSALLKRLDHEVFTAKNVAEAVDVFLRERPRVVLTDLRMPAEGDGFRLAEALRLEAKSKGEQVCLALMTGDSHTLTDSEKGIFDAILEKPLLLKDLQKLLEDTKC